MKRDLMSFKQKVLYLEVVIFLFSWRVDVGYGVWFMFFRIRRKMILFVDQIGKEVFIQNYVFFFVIIYVFNYYFQLQNYEFLFINIDGILISCR